MANNRHRNVNLVYDKKNNRVVVKNTNNRKKKMPINGDDLSLSNNNLKKSIDLDTTAKINSKLENDVSEAKNIDNKNITITKVVKSNIPKDAISLKEKNKQKYEARQKRYANTKNKKKKVLDIGTSNLEKVHKEIKNELKKKEKIKKVPDEEKVTPIKKKSVIKEEQKQDDKKANFRTKRNEIINHIKEKSSDNTIPLGNEKSDNRIRVKRYLKESIVHAIIITIINVIAFFIFDYVNYLKLFDIEYLNYIVTIILSLIISYIFAFFVDCLVTEIWTNIKTKQKMVGVTNGDSGVK